MNRRGTEREIGLGRPVLLRNQAILALRSVGVGIDETGHNRLAGHIDHARAGRNSHAAARPNGDNTITLNDDRAVFDDPAIVAAHGHDAGASQHHGSSRLVRPDGAGQCNAALGRRIAGMINHARVRAVKRRSDAPVHLRPAPREVDEIAAALAQADGRQSALLRRRFDVLRAGEQRHQKGFIILAESHGAAVRRDLEIARKVTRRVHALRFTRQVSADQLQLVRFLGGHENAVVGLAKLRVGRIALHQPRIAPANGYDVNSRVPAPLVRREAATRARLERHGPAVGRKAQIGVMPGLRCDRLGIASASGHYLDSAEVTVVPADEGDQAAVARPGRPGLEVSVVFGQAAGCSSPRGADP